MKIRMDIPDEIYTYYKELAESKGFAVTKLNQILFREAVENWVLQSQANDLNTCEICGTKINKGTGLIVTKQNQEEQHFMLWERHYYCEDCYRPHMNDDNDSINGSQF